MSISKEHYSLFVLDSEDRVVPCEWSAFKLDHGQQYKVMIYNHNPKRRIDAEVKIDGKKVGLFRVDQKSSIVVERPVDEGKARKLTFYDRRSKEGRMAGLTNSDSLGNIDVNIWIETDRELDEVDGGTGLGAASYQKFRTVCPMEVQQSKIHLSGRMVLNDAAVVPL